MVKRLKSRFAANFRGIGARHNSFLNEFSITHYITGPSLRYSIMNSFFKWVGIAALSVITFAVAAIGYFAWVTSRQETALKPRIMQLANGFFECIKKENVDPCYEDLTSDVFKKAMGRRQFADFTRMIKTKLGDRYVSEPIEKSQNLIVNYGPEGKTLRYQIAIKGLYQNDVAVVEKLMFAGKDSESFRLEAIMVNSDRLTK